MLTQAAGTHPASTCFPHGGELPYPPGRRRQRVGPFAPALDATPPLRMACPSELHADRVAWFVSMGRSPQEILESATTVAVVGASRDPAKEAGSVPGIMQEHGFRVIPVNPYADELLGERVYRSLRDIPEPVDIVDVFRPSAEAADVARQAASIGAGAVWLQQDIVSAEARRIAEDSGMDYVEDLCIAVARALYQVDKHIA